MTIFKYIFLGMLIICFCINISDLYAQQSEIIIATGELPPYSFSKEGKLYGVATEIVKELMRRTSFTKEIISLPWKRAIVKSEKEKRRLTYPLDRNAREREKKYKWIGPILRDERVFVVLSSDTDDYKSIDDLKNLRVGVNRGSPSEKRLIARNFRQIDATSKEEFNAKKLIAGRIDAWSSPLLMIKAQLQDLGIDQKKIRIAFVDSEIQMYIAATLDIEDKLVDLWQKKLDEMKSDGTYQAILKKYNID